jgi:hypothetical protein
MFLLSIILLLRTIKKKVLTNIVNEFYGHMIDLRDQESKDKTNVLIGCHQKSKNKTNVLIGCHQKSKKKNVPICTIKVVILYSGSVKTRKCSKFEI